MADNKYAKNPDCAMCKIDWPIHDDSGKPCHIDVLGNHPDYGNWFPCPLPELPDYLKDEEEAGRNHVGK